MFPSIIGILANTDGFLSYRVITFQNNPYSYYKFDEVSGTTAVDYIGLANGITVNATANQNSLISGNTDPSILFSSSNSAYFEVATNSSIQNTLAASFLIKVVSLPSGSPASILSIANSTASTEGIVLLLNTDGTLTVIAKNSGGSTLANVSTVSSLDVDTVYHLAINITGNTTSDYIEIYINGSLNGQSSAFSSTLSIGAYPLRIAKSTDTTYTYLDAYIDELALFTSSVTANFISQQSYIALRTYRALIISQQPEAYWQLGESSGSTVYNSLDNTARNGTAFNTPTQNSTGLVLTNDSDTCYTFTNTNSEYIDIAYNSWMLASSITVSFWVKPTGTSSREVITRGEGGQYSWGIALSNQVYVSMWNCGGSGYRTVFSTAGGIVANNIYNIVVIISGAITKIYINGQFAVSSTAASGIWCSTSTAKLRIAGRGDGSGFGYFDGEIDEVAYWSRELNEEEIAAQYELGA